MALLLEHTVAAAARPESAPLSAAAQAARVQTLESALERARREAARSSVACVSNCEAAFPALEVWWTSRECESISTKERRAGAQFQPPPVLDSRSLAVRFPHLREFTLVNVDVDKHSFVNWDAPSLEKVRLDPVGEASWQAASSWG